MFSLHMILLVVAFVLEVLAFFNVPSGKVNLMAGGLAFFLLSLIV